MLEGVCCRARQALGKGAPPIHPSCVERRAEGRSGQLDFTGALASRPTRRADWRRNARSAPPPRPSCLARWGWSGGRAGCTASLPSRSTASPIGDARLGQHRHRVPAVSSAGAGAAGAPAARLRSLRTPLPRRLVTQCSVSTAAASQLSRPLGLERRARRLHGFAPFALHCLADW